MENEPRPLRPNMALVLFACIVLFSLLLAGARKLQKSNPDYFSVSNISAPSSRTGNLNNPATKAPDVHPTPIMTPTPDNPHPIPSPRPQKEEQYTVQAGDSLALIAQKYSVGVEKILEVNQIADPNYLEVGQSLTIPAVPPQAGPDFKIIPDSELVYGPASASFDVAAAIQQGGGYLASYQEEINGEMWSGAQIVQRIAQDYSVNPRLLLAVLEYKSGWVTKKNPRQASLEYPMGVRIPLREGLYRQLAWTANELNRGFYLWRVNGVGSWLLGDGSVVQISPTINAGTAGVQHMLALLYSLDEWREAVTETGLFETYVALFGYPFGYALEPLRPADLQQPVLQLPFEMGDKWSFTGGPHGGWDDGSAWAALDFAPPGEALGCVPSDSWVTAAADGPVVRTGDGAVMQDLDGDGIEQTGWVIFYMHIAGDGRVQPGANLKTGERVGRPSCEGGVSNGTHVHIARKYNGEWIPADQDELAFIMDGWVSSGAGRQYDGFLEKDGVVIEAYEGRSPENRIRR